MTTPLHCPKCPSENVVFNKKRGVDFCEDCGYTFPPEKRSKKVVSPLRIFLSYGHDKNEPLVRRIRDDLKKRGHHVWFDQTPEEGKGIRAGDDWRQKITEGIKKSKSVVSFLSKHSTRDPGVCRDEIAIAIGVKKGNIQTILVESEKEVEPPVSISHIQWLNMHDWNTGHGSVATSRNVSAAGDKDWETYYKSNFKEIIRIVESEETRRFGGEIEKLKKYLLPIESGERFRELIEKGFVGRKWLEDRVKDWRAKDPDDSRIFWITGNPGVGKSALVAHLTHTSPDAVIAAQFVEWNKPDHRDARRVIRSIAFQLATRLPDYRKCLLDLPEIKSLDAKNPCELFRYLLTNILGISIDGGRMRYLIVIDALDEATEGGENELVNVLATDAHLLPHWLAFVVTSRPESDVTARLQALRPWRLDTETPENREDLRSYLNKKLGDELGKRKDRSELVERILDQSEGVFLYLEHFCEEVKKGSLSLDRPEQFPQGLGGIYFQWCRRQFPENYEEIEPALGAILAAREPIPVEILKECFGWRNPELEKWLRTLGSLFTVTGENGNRTIKPNHKYVRDWLTDSEKAAHYFVSLNDGEKLLAGYGLSEYKKGRDPLPYFIRHLIPHLVDANQLNKAAELLLDLRWLETKVDAGLAFEMAEDFDQVLKVLMGSGAPEDRVEIPLRLIGEAIRTDIHFIANSIEYPQALMQSVTNYLRPVTTPSRDDSPTAGFPQDVTAQLQELTAEWEEYTSKKRRSWIKRLGIDRERVLAGPLRWRADTPEDRSGGTSHSMVFSPKGDAIAVAADWFYGNRPDRPPDWTRAYAITVWSSNTGRLLSRLYPNPSGINLTDPPPDVPRPPEVEQLFQDYFALRAVEKSKPLKRFPAPNLRLSFAALAQEGQHEIEEAPERSVGKGWCTALIAGDVGALCWLDDRTLLAGGRGGLIFIFDVETGVQSGIVLGTNVDTEFKIHSWNDVEVCCLAKIGTDKVVAGTSYGTIELIELTEPKSRTVCFVLKPAGQPVRSLAWHDKSRQLAVGTDFGTIHIVSPGKDWSSLWELSGHRDAATSLAWSPSGDRLASVSWDRTLRMWDIGTGKEMWRSPEHPHDDLRVSWGLAEDEVLTTWNETEQGGRVRVWNATTGEPLGGFGVAQPFFKSIARSCSRKLVAVSAAGKIQMYAPNVQGVHLLPPNSHSGGVRDARICYPRGEIATLANDGIRVWSAETGHWLKCRPASSDWRRSVNRDHHIRYSPDGSSLACVLGGTIYMLDAETLDHRWTKSVKIGQGCDVTRCGFSEDSELFFTDDDRAPDLPGVDSGSGPMLWEVKTGRWLSDPDQSGSTDVDAAFYLHRRAEHETTFEAMYPKWKGSFSTKKEAGLTDFKGEDDSGCKFQFRVSGLVHGSLAFKLKAFGEWIVLFEGAKAPSKLCVVHPESVK